VCSERSTGCSAEQAHSPTNHATRIPQHTTPSHVFQSVEESKDKRDDRSALDSQVRAVTDLLDGLKHRQRGGAGGGGGVGGGGGSSSGLMGGDKSSSKQTSKAAAD